MHPSPRETSPLLRVPECGAASDTEQASDGSHEIPSNEQLRTIQATFAQELLRQTKAAVPLIIAYALQNSIQTVAVLVAGRLGAHELSVAAFSMMLAMVTGWCVALGGTTALDTFGSASFSGSPRKTDVGLHLQRCLFWLHILLIPVLALWWFCEPVLLFLKQEEEIAHDVQSFLRVLIVGAPGYVCFESMRKYLQCQGIMEAGTYVLLITSPLNLALNLWLIHRTTLGLFGAPVAISITYWTSFLLLVAYAAISRVHADNGTWGGIELQKAMSWRAGIEFLRIAVPGILMVGTEWWAFEIVAIAAGQLGALPLAAQSCIMTMDQVMNTIPFGLGVAASVRVGNLLGLGSAPGARIAGHAAAALSVAFGGTVMLLMLLKRDTFGYLFTDDEDTVRLVAQVLPLVASFQIADGLAGSCGGTLRGQGRQHLGAAFNLFAYYIIALPLGITLAFTFNKGLAGLWIGQVVGLFIVGLSEYAVVAFGTNWDLEVSKAAERNRLEERSK
ncbi:MOP flippase [Auricularia subglabra TFB-10046 SS5]|nr:MOP flippase [Auricularia subglabra TFB-10046 SS5]